PWFDLEDRQAYLDLFLLGQDLGGGQGVTLANAHPKVGFLADAPCELVGLLRLDDQHRTDVVLAVDLALAGVVTAQVSRLVFVGLLFLLLCLTGRGEEQDQSEGRQTDAFRRGEHDGTPWSEENRERYTGKCRLVVSGGPVLRPAPVRRVARSVSDA